MTAWIANIGFGAPAILWGLALLPVIWWLLRLTPPRPDRLVFPPFRLLLGLQTREQTPAHSPWWLMALRMALATLVIVALADPILNPHSTRAPLEGPLVLVVDNGWAAAPEWTSRRDLLRAEIEHAKRYDQAVILAPTAPSAQPLGLLRETAADALARAGLISPEPHAPDRMALVPRLETLLESEEKATLVWLADGLGYSGDSSFAGVLAGFSGISELRIFSPEPGTGPLALAAPSHGEGGLEIEIMRAEKGPAREGKIIARALNGRVLGEAPFHMPANKRIITANLNMPLELRNEVSRVEVELENSAGAVQLLDERWRKKRVGLISGDTARLGQPLLSPLFYVERALSPYAELTRPRDATLPDRVGELIEARVGAMILTDVGTLANDTREVLDAWVRDGGVLIRFAGPHLGASSPVLVPVKLRSGARALGGTLSWSTPQRLAEFAAQGAFNSISVPGDVTVSRQVLAEPDIALATRTWARLADGTPLVTAARHANGWIILFHVTADPSWSNLPLSGAFVDMLRALISLAGNTSAASPETLPEAVTDTEVAAPNLPPVINLDASGVAGAPPPTAIPITASEFGDTRAGPAHPPGFYGFDSALRALNTLPRGEVLKPMSQLPANVLNERYQLLAPEPIRSWLFAFAALLLILDSLAVIAITGFGRRARAIATGAGVLALLVSLSGSPNPAFSQELSREEEFALRATELTRLAYVLTGVTRIDEISRAGLRGLSVMLGRRTALEPGDPMGVDVSSDELAFFPLLYWAIDPAAQEPDADTLARIDAYMRRGGTILFDTRDQVLSTNAGGPGMVALRRILSKLDIPALEPVPADHVLTKAFYLLQDFPGRFDGGALWTQADLRQDSNLDRPVRNSDGVSSILITSNDLAAAWAMDDRGRPLLPVVPGGDRQREMAYRVGINLVMYTLTGNYKADQVHIPALLERLGQ